VSGTAECGKTQFAFHSDLHVGGLISGKPAIKRINPELKTNDQNTNMNTTNQTNNVTANISNNSKRKARPWWLVLFLMAPLV
jgi:hypothetical protein